MQVTPETIQAKLEELLELLSSAESKPEAYPEIAHWRYVAKGIRLIRAYWAKEVMHREETIWDLVEKALDQDFTE